MSGMNQSYLPSVRAELNNLLEHGFLDIGQGDLLLDAGVVDHSLDEDGLGRDIDIDFHLFTLASYKLNFRHFVFFTYLKLYYNTRLAGRLF